MIITDLETHLLPAIAGAEEIWIAVALITDDGFQKIRPALAGIKQNYLIGINLPTEPSALHQIMESIRPGRIRARLAGDAPTFHPKVYIIKNPNGYLAFVGSANLTVPGLRGNHEMSYMVTDQGDCQRLVSWFQEHYDQAFILDKDIIDDYRDNYPPEDQGSAANHTRRPLRLRRPSGNDKIFEDRDLTHQYFGKNDYLAFRQELQRDDSKEANRERSVVWEKFRQFHRELFPQLAANDIDNLDHHARDHNIVSLYYHVEKGEKDINAMWLSYGKKQAEVRRYQNAHKIDYTESERDGERDPYSFINHSRLQVRIEMKPMGFGIWLLFAKNNAGDYDRKHFRDKMDEDSRYRQDFYDRLKSLRDPYWIRVNTQRRLVTEFTSPDQLHQFTRTDRRQEYFTIGRDYDIADPALFANPIATNHPSRIPSAFSAL
ncbi:phospholipase D-like domain-containing protein [Puia sp. P3]|uniref:phospholipase D-like domain-containing protein n=1 Tax=Puia sp. P3 TaxID=3423952 RepID=UPI003D675F66